MTVKEIANDIIRKKYALKGNGEIYVICDKKTRNALDEAGFIIRWKDVYPGSVIYHIKICGVDYVSSSYIPMSKESESDGYEVITKKEWRERYKERVSKSNI